MPAPSAIDALTPEQRTALDQAITQRNFANYDGLVAWLTEQGFELSRSTVARHGNKLKRRLQQVRDSTEGARLIAQAAPDDADLRSAAVISMVQSELFNVMVSLQDLEDATDPAERICLLKDAAKSIAEMSKASVNQKKWELGIRKQERDRAVQEVSAALKQNGISEEVEASIKRILIGK